MRINSQENVVVFSDRAYNAIISESFSKDPNETGGFFLGHVLSTGVWIVMEVLPPGPNSIHQYAYFEYDTPFANYLAARVALQYDIPLQVLGFWHRHPGSMDVFSGVDAGTNGDFARRGGPLGAISALVNIDPVFRLTMYHVAQPHVYTKIDIAVGDSLIPEEYFKLKYYPSLGKNPPLPRRRESQQQPPRLEIGEFDPAFRQAGITGTNSQAPSVASKKTRRHSEQGDDSEFEEKPHSLAGRSLEKLKKAARDLGVPFSFLLAAIGLVVVIALLLFIGTETSKLFEPDKNPVPFDDSKQVRNPPTKRESPRNHVPPKRENSPAIAATTMLPYQNNETPWFERNTELFSLEQRNLAKFPKGKFLKKGKPTLVFAVEISGNPVELSYPENYPDQTPKIHLTQLKKDVSHPLLHAVGDNLFQLDLPATQATAQTSLDALDFANLWLEQYNQLQSNKIKPDEFQKFPQK